MGVKRKTEDFGRAAGGENSQIGRFRPVGDRRRRTLAARRCCVCSFDRWHIVTVKRKSGALYTTSLLWVQGVTSSIATCPDLEYPFASRGKG